MALPLEEHARIVPLVQGLSNECVDIKVVPDVGSGHPEAASRLRRTVTTEAGIILLVTVVTAVLFSATFSASNRLKCWNTMATPEARAARGSAGTFEQILHFERPKNHFAAVIGGV